MTPPLPTWSCQALSLLAHLALALLAGALLEPSARFGMEVGTSSADPHAPSILFAEVEAEPLPPEPEPEPLPAVVQIEPDPSELEPVPSPQPEPKPPRTSPPRPRSSPVQAGAGDSAPGPPGIRTISRADYLRNPPPDYPADSRRRGEQGTVSLLVDVSPEGRPQNVVIRSSSGYPALDAAARSAVSRWRFQPASIGGLRVASQVIVPIRFELDRSP